MPASFCRTSFSVIWHTITQINSITCLGPGTSNLFGKVLKRWKMTGCTGIQYALMKGMGHTLIVSRKSKKQFISSSNVMVLSSRAGIPYKFGIGVGPCVNIISSHTQGMHHWKHMGSNNGMGHMEPGSLVKRLSPWGGTKEWTLKGSPFHALKGLPLTPGIYRAVVWAVQGDHEMYSNTLHLPHWNAGSPCWDCDCKQPFSKGTPCEKGKSFKFVKEEKQRFIYVDTKAALLKGKTKHPLFSVPGLTTRMVRHDGLHVLLVRGVCAYL